MWYNIGMIWLLLGCVFEMLFTYGLATEQASGFLAFAIGFCLSMGGTILYATNHWRVKEATKHVGRIIQPKVQSQ